MSVGCTLAVLRSRKARMRRWIHYPRCATVAISESSTDRFGIGPAISGKRLQYRDEMVSGAWRRHAPPIPSPSAQRARFGSILRKTIGGALGRGIDRPVRIMSVSRHPDQPRQQTETPPPTKGRAGPRAARNRRRTSADADMRRTSPFKPAPITAPLSAANDRHAAVVNAIEHTGCHIWSAAGLGGRARSVRTNRGGRKMRKMIAGAMDHHGADAVRQIREANPGSQRMMPSCAHCVWRGG